MKAIIQATCYRSNRLIQILLAFCIGVGAQTINLTGTVVDSATSQGISGANVKIVEIPKCTTKTTANGSFTLTYTSGILPFSSVGTAEEIQLTGNALLINSAKSSSRIYIEVFNCEGVRTCNLQKTGGLNHTVAFSDLWETPGWYNIKADIDGKDYSVSGIGMNSAFFPANSSLRSNIQKSMAKAWATYTLYVYAIGYVIKQVAITDPSGNLGTIKLSKAPKVSTGTGTNYQPAYVTVTGGGAMPDIANGYTCNCDGTGATDASSCLRNAANMAASQKKPLLIPYTTGYYKITRAININCSVIGIGGMPTIQQASTGGSIDYAGLSLATNMTGWIYNLHIVGSYNGSNNNGEWAPNIAINQANGVTIKGCLLENAMGDNIWDANSKPAGARNILIDGNTFLNPYRCIIGLCSISDRWAIINNLSSKQTSGQFDYEPNEDADCITNIEMGYNKVSQRTIDNLKAVPLAMSGYWDPTPGGNIYTHHNYGTWPNPTEFVQMWGYKGGAVSWTNVVTLKNVQGNTVPQ